MADERLQDDDQVRDHLRNHDRLAMLRAPWESMWREIDERVNPMGAGTIGASAGAAGRMSRAGTVKGAQNFDVTAVQSLGRFAAAMAAITVPRNTQYIRLRFAASHVLADLRHYCFATADGRRPIFDTDPAVMGRRLGRREAFDRIMSYLNLDEEAVQKLMEIDDGI